MRFLKRASAALLLVFVLAAVPLALFADSVGPTIAGTGADDSSLGTFVWNSPGNITADDGSEAQSQATAGGTSTYLRASNFGFSIPAGATINGITAVIERRSALSTQEAKDQEVKIVKADATKGTTNKAIATVYPTTLTAQSYGGAADLWNETWTSTDINDSDFGFVLMSQRHDASGVMYVDYMSITIDYTPAPAGVSAPQKQSRSIILY
jgi:hypothetical protein